MDFQALYDSILQRKKGGDKLTFAWIAKQTCIDVLSSMFTYGGLPDTIPEEFVEQYLIINGSESGWTYDGPDEEFKEKQIVSIGDEAEHPNVYGIGRKYIASTQNGYVKTLTPGVDCAVIYNNSLHESDMGIINAFVDLITEAFVSLKTNILYSRYKPVFKANKDIERAAIVEAFNKVKNDLEPIVITSDNILEQIDGAEESIKTLDITDVNNADKIQYIVKTIDDCFRWFFTLYGQAVQGNGKLAQQSVREVDGSTSLSFIYPNDRLKMRQRGWDQFNKLFGTNVTVRFSDAWLTESIKYKNEADIDGDQMLEEAESCEDVTRETSDGEQQEERTDEQPEEQEDKEKGENEE